MDFHSLDALHSAEDSHQFDLNEMHEDNVRTTETLESHAHNKIHQTLHKERALNRSRFFVVHFLLLCFVQHVYVPI